MAQIDSDMHAASVCFRLMVDHVQLFINTVKMSLSGMILILYKSSYITTA